ncbi:pyruvate kinase [Paraburkholderia atlantica]|uniref:Pyruvate kinase n=1 Tax=Paraburkholderia atlantica TaxID=2654982 RepID=D5WL78_PARAM|nr:pyruvate kinase [Paraburkholderia atlantica]
MGSRAGCVTPINGRNLLEKLNTDTDVLERFEMHHRKNTARRRKLCVSSGGSLGPGMRS